MANWLSHRTIIEEQDAEKAVDKFVKKYDRFEKVFEALKWLLARKCDKVGSLKNTVDGIEYHICTGKPVIHWRESQILL